MVSMLNSGLKLTSKLQQPNNFIFILVLLQDLQAQHATMKLREQTCLAKTDYRTLKVLNPLQYPLINNFIVVDIT